MKKLIAKLSVIALLAGLVIVPTSNAAGVTITAASADRTTFTIGLPAGVDLETADVVTLKITTTANGNAVDLSGNDTTAIYLAGDANTADTITNNGDANGYIVMTEDGVEDPAAGEDLTFTLTSALATDAAYTIMYRDSDNNYGAAMINFGTANQVTVTARVEPTLTLALVNTAIDLGTLSPSSVTSSSSNTAVTVATNADSGVVVAVSDDDGAAAGANTGLDSALTDGNMPGDDTLAAGTAGFDVLVSETADPQTNGAIHANFDDAAGNDVALTTSAQTIGSTTAATAGYAMDVQYRAAISTITPAAADYTTTLTYTATATY